MPMFDILVCLAASGWLIVLRRVGLMGPFGFSAIGYPVLWSIAILRVFSCLLARPSSFAALSAFIVLARLSNVASFFSSLTLSAYLNVLSVCSLQLEAGEMFAIMVVLLLPTKESLRTWVSFDPRKGVCFLSKSRALIHSFKASKDLLISAPSSLVYLSVCIVSAPLSDPARSMKLILLYSLSLCLSTICMMACERELSALAPVEPLARSPIPT